MIYLVEVSLRDCIAPSFYGVHNSIQNNEYGSYWFKGGRGSTKSSFVAMQVILGIIADPEANAVIYRKVGSTIKGSVLTTLLWAMGKLGVRGLFSYIKSPTEITYKPTGQKIILSGLDDPEKSKSIKIEVGYFKIIWFEELPEFHGMKEIRSVIQSVVRGGETYLGFFTYNPPNDAAAWVNVEAGKEVSGRLVHTSNYLQVNKGWLGSPFVKLAEELKLSDRTAYDHEYMGLAVGRAEQIIFHGKWEEKEFDTPHINKMYQSRFFIGADWGFANDPTALTRSFMLAENGEINLYIDYEAGGHGIELDELPQIFNQIPDIKRWKVYGDASRPETVSHMRNKSYNCESAPKWSGSVEDGVEYLRSFNRIYIHPRCKNVIEEFSKYSYKVDKHTQEILPVIVDKWNHYIDALRYSLADYIKGEVSILDVL